MVRRRSTLPLFATDDGWPYRDGDVGPADDGEPDLDAMELRRPGAFDSLTPAELTALGGRFGFGRTRCSIGTLAAELDCSPAEASATVDRAVAKIARHLRA